MHPRVVGLTGGIASGKSTVARAFAALGMPVIDADLLAREVVAPGGDALRELAAAFGTEILSADGSLDRKALGARVFGAPAALAKLNAITHPRIGMLSATRVREALASGAPYVLYEAALIVENNLHRTMGALVVVSVSPDVQRARLMAREGLSADDAELRLRSQAPLEAKLKAATYVIDNSGPPEALPARVSAVHLALLATLGALPSTPDGGP
jgi:dephospho-CoA kinase